MRLNRFMQDLSAPVRTHSYEMASLSTICRMLKPRPESPHARISGRGETMHTRPNIQKAQPGGGRLLLSFPLLLSRTDTRQARLGKIEAPHTQRFVTRRVLHTQR
jgi:hypothetical protein